MLGPTTLYQLAQTVHEDRLREVEQHRRIRLVARPVRRGFYAVLLAGLGRRLIQMGEGMQAKPEHSLTRA